MCYGDSTDIVTDTDFSCSVSDDRTLLRTFFVSFMNFLSPQLQQSPGRQQQESFQRTLSNQTPKHPGISEEGGFTGLAGHTLGHDPFVQGQMMTGHSQTDKTSTNEMAALAAASLDGPMSILPQIGDSEEKLRQVGQAFSSKKHFHLVDISAGSCCVLSSSWSYCVLSVCVPCSVSGSGSSS